ncbi:DUF3298 and DUF4163 domain-containing protein [Cytobacillus spongiae]|jgi:hypothetical protein|uniref:DUF3298 and DUF4163 domain-containing protein n=1 Tax=Cytobacillus spongiae TaxID=2901381 RepID=UPI001F262F61|nr:DUF3298 and DUF4163 domain-containing protein [Cytobacillus spongiae]UII55864.1 DUF3298 and DUF4163 domain-containing protein [Cytobacillus spongiae]
MDKKLEEMKELYEHIEVPKELDRVIQAAILRKRKKSRNGYRIARTIGAIAAITAISFTLAVNASSAVAQTLYKIPVIDELARFVTLRDYEFENETSKGKVHTPEVNYNKDQTIEDKINTIIQDKIDMVIREQAQLDEEYKEAYLETGGKEEDFQKVEMTVDYKIGYSDEQLLSFEIYKYQTLAPAYNENFYYTFDLQSGELLSLKELLGEDFAKTVQEKVLDEMEHRMEIKPEEEYDIQFYEYTPIDETRSFYINQEGKIMVTFAKYEVAAGYMGAQEFEVGEIK